MKTLFKKYGLAARQKTIDKIKKIISRFNARLGILILAPVMLSSCHEKTNGQDFEIKKQGRTSVAQDSLTKPKVSIQVNRRYDDKGNMVGFDSVYSSFYSNVSGDTVQMDSLMNSFDRYFNRNHSSFFRNEFTPLFFNDSLRYPDFFHNDFFMKRYELNDQYLRDMMHRMDSIKNRFYQEHSEKRNNAKDL
jgi:hypothetical protein